MRRHRVVEWRQASWLELAWRSRPLHRNGRFDVRTKPLGRHAQLQRNRSLPSRATQHTWPPRPAAPELSFPSRPGAALGRRASTLGRHTQLHRNCRFHPEQLSTLGRHAPFLLLTEFLAGEWRYSATRLSGISDAKHACVVLCFQLPSRCSSTSRFERARQSDNSIRQNSIDKSLLEFRFVRFDLSVCVSRQEHEVCEPARQKSNARQLRTKDYTSVLRIADS